MGVFVGIVGYLLDVAGSFYLMAALAVLTRCIYDEDMVWNHSRKWFLLLLAIVNEGIDYLSYVWHWKMPGAVLFVLFFTAYMLILVYGCHEKWLKRCLRAVTMLFGVSMCFYMICDIGGYYIIPGYQLMRPASASVTMEDWLMKGELLIVFAVVYYYFTYRILKKGLFIPFGRKEKWLTAFYCMYIVSIYVMVVISLDDKTAQAAAVQTAMAFLLLLFSIVFPVFIYKNRMSAYYRELKEYQEDFLQAELVHFRQYKEAQEETRRFRHDIQNNLVCLRMLLEENKTDEASDYLSGLLQNVQNLSPNIVTGNEILDCIISAKSGEMKREGISFRLDGLLDAGLQWKAVDICSVFANALDNAIEACLKIPEQEKRFISMSFKHTKQFYCIEIMNAVAEDIDCKKLLNPSDVYTSKDNRRLHGFGFGNMQRTIEKYNGILKIDCADRIFRVVLTVSR